MLSAMYVHLFQQNNVHLFSYNSETENKKYRKLICSSFHVGNTYLPIKICLIVTLTSTFSEILKNQLGWSLGNLPQHLNYS